MKKIKIIVVIVIMSILASCQKDIPEPETKKTSIKSNQVVEASSWSNNENNDPLFIRHIVKGQDVYIECIVKGASFRNNGAKIILTIDGKKQQTINSAAFVVKGLSTGQHQVKLELFKGTDEKAAANKEFEVVIPSY